MPSHTRISLPAGTMMLVLLLLAAAPAGISAQSAYLIDKSDPACTNQGPGSLERPWCNLWGINEKWLDPGSTVFIKAGTYIGNEDSTQTFEYHNGIGIRGFGTREAPFTLRAWPGDEGQVDIHSGKRDDKYAFLFWGGHLRVKGINFIGHVDIPDEGRLYAPRVIRFAITDGPVTNVRFDSVRVVGFQGADDIWLGCRHRHLPPVGECSIPRSAEGWSRGIDINGLSEFAFENGEVTCTDEPGKNGLEEIRAQGLYLGADGIKSGESCSNVLVRNSYFGACGHNNLMFTGCDSVVVEHNLFDNELHRSVSLTYGRHNTIRYNTFAAFEERRVELVNAGGNAVQFRTSESKVHHNVFYGGGEPRHDGALKIAALDNFRVHGNDIFNNVTLARNSMSFRINDKFEAPFNLQNNRIFNNIFVGEDTEGGVLSWGSAEREAYFDGVTFGNEIRNNIIYSLTDDPVIVSELRFIQPIELSIDEFNALEVASGNIVGDPGFAKIDFDDPDFHIVSSCLAHEAGLPVDVESDFTGNPIGKDGRRPSIGVYASSMAPFSAPRPAWPEDRARGIAPFANFIWTGVPGADRYHVQVFLEESSEGELYMEVSDWASTEFLLDQPLPYDSRFRWRARASGSNGVSLHEDSGCTPWSEEALFKTAVGTHVGGPNSDATVPVRFSVEGLYPNPFSGSTSLLIEIPDQRQVRVTVFDALGRAVAVPIDQYLPAGRHEVKWKPHTPASGTFFLEVVAGSDVWSGSAVRVK